MGPCLAEQLIKIADIGPTHAEVGIARLDLPARMKAPNRLTHRYPSCRYGLLDPAARADRFGVARRAVANGYARTCRCVCAFADERRFRIALLVGEQDRSQR